jgi:eukaryotic-like serine/threonine-protein kinase
VARPAEGAIVDQRYRLKRKIGVGGMADVWLADDSELDREVAIKVLHDRYAQDKEFVERFRHEAQAAGGLQHPNVVSIFDRGGFDDTFFIAMEYVDGPSLKTLIKGGIGIKDAVDFTRQILQAARFAHRKGIIHRDLKPQNVLIDDEGRARVADFGIARGEASDITEAGEVMGTAQYLSPEQAQGKETTARSDLYSIGVILYEALTGRVPFEGDQAVTVALKQVSERPRRPSAVNPKIPPALDAVVMRALAKDPEARFNDADAFLRALDAAERAPDQPRPQDTAAFAAVSPEGEQLVEEAVIEEYPSERRRRRWLRWLLLALLVAGVAALLAFALTRPERVTVPNVTSESTCGQGSQQGCVFADAAIAQLESAGLDAEIDPVPNAAPREAVLEQDPLPGERIDEGDTVVLSVSAGPLIVKVPDVSGLSEQAARKRLENAGFEVGRELRFSRSVGRGNVIGTEPAAETRLPRGATVTLLVSRGQNRVVVPSVIGLQQEDAVAQVEDAGLDANVAERADEAPQGQVIDQSPSGGELVDRGRTVTIFVSTGVVDVDVPDVVGSTRRQAVNSLKAAGLSVSVREESTEDPRQDGRVTQQFPPGGARAQPGDTVSIVVGDFQPAPPPPTTTTP